MSRILTPIGRCSAKLRRKLEIDEEEALRFRIRVRRRRTEGELAKGATGGRWQAVPNFASPGPFGDRPESPEGHVSFHYGITTVSKGPSGKSVVSDSRGRVSETDRCPGDHDEYVARPGAVMTIGPAEFDQYAARANVTDLSTGKAGIALLSNISLDPTERASFWKAVDAAARKAGPDRLILDPKRGSKREWKALAAGGDVPANLREIAAEIAAGNRTRKAEIPMNEVDAKAAIETICRFVPKADRKKGPVRFARGRKGRTQYRLEAELPDGLDNAARVRLMFKLAEAVEATRAMYTIAIHEPDEHNDERNFHLHLVAHDRPARMIDGKWDFTIAEPVKGQSGRVRFSERKKKIVLDRLKTATNRGDFGAFLKDLRWRFADLCNEELLAAGRTRLFDPRKYTEMGIDREPTKPLGTRLAPLEAAGVPTKVGIHNAEIIWTYELKIRLRRFEADRLLRQESIERLRAAVDRLPQNDPDATAAEAQLECAIQAAALLDVVEPELAEYEVTLAMASARPAKTLDTCSRILKEIEAGRGSSSDRRNRTRIKDRLVEAETFLRDIERIDRANQKVIADQLPMIEQARRDIAAAAERLAGLETISRPVSRPTVAQALTTPSMFAHDITPPRAPTDAHALTPEAAAAISATPPSGAPAPPGRLYYSAVTLEAIIARVRFDRLIVLGPEYHGGTDYRVGGVTREELQVLRDPDIADRAQAELRLVATDQAKEIEAAYLIYRSHGHARAEQIAADSAGRPSPSNNPLGVLKAYCAHPRAASLMGWEAPEPVKSTGKAQSIWRRMRVSIADVLSRPGDHQPEAQPEGSERDRATSGSPNMPPQLDTPAKATPSLDDAIAEYAEVIRTDADVRFITLEGEMRVDPSSVPDWRRSVEAFEDHEAVRAAITDRWEEEQKNAQRAQRRRQKSDDIRAEKSARIVAGLKAGTLIARQTKTGWVVDGTDEDLVFFANRWRDSPELLAAFTNHTSRQPGKYPPPTLHATLPRPPASCKPGSSAPALAPSLGNVRTSQSADPAGGYTLRDQRWLLDRESGRGVG